jgi:cytochrome bd-type quinol oxidase subunit 2
MNRVKNPLFQWSLTIALLTGLLGRVLLRPESPLAEISPWMQNLAVVVLSLLPMIGIVFGVLCWKRKEVKAGWSILAIVLNAVEFLLILLRLFSLSLD